VESGDLYDVELPEMAEDEFPMLDGESVEEEHGREERALA
jgi:twitching motility protein PilJ